MRSVTVPVADALACYRLQAGRVERADGDHWLAAEPTARTTEANAAFWLMRALEDALIRDLSSVAIGGYPGSWRDVVARALPMLNHPYVWPDRPLLRCSIGNDVLRPSRWGHACVVLLLWSTSMSTPHSTTPTPDYSDMVNTTRVRSSLRRLFGGALDEILAELLQNAQRAGATTIQITTTASSWTFADNGAGLAPGLDAFWTLLRIAESAYANPTIEAQDPIGLGIHALLAHQQVHDVSFASGSLALRIAPARWWTDEAYYRSWAERVVTLETPVTGFQIEVLCTPAMVAALRKALEPVDHDVLQARTWTAFQGADDIFPQVTCDGVAVRTTVPKSVVPERVLTRTTYQRQELVIGGSWKELGTDYMYGGERGRATVNWYGQLIPVRPLRGWMYYLKVRAGRPINPKSPSRQGLIEDAALEALEQFVRDTIFATLADPANRERVTPMMVHAAFLLDPARAEQLPYLVVAPYTFDPDGANIDDFGGTGDCVLATYDALPLLLDEEIAIDERVMDVIETARPAPEAGASEQSADDAAATDAEEADDAEDADVALSSMQYGLHGFVPVLAAAGFQAFHLVAGSRERAGVQTLVWQPGALRADDFNALGQFGFAAEDELPATWHAVTGVPSVFAFPDGSGYEPIAIEWVVGTTDPLAFLRNEVWFGFAPDDDEEYDTQEARYRAGVNAWKRRLIGDCVPEHFTYAQVRQQMPTPGSPIVSIRYVLPRKQRGVAAGKDRREPRAIIARNAAGEQKELTLIA